MFLKILSLQPDTVNWQYAVLVTQPVVNTYLYSPLCCGAARENAMLFWDLNLVNIYVIMIWCLLDENLVLYAIF